MFDDEPPEPAARRARNSEAPVDEKLPVAKEGTLDAAPFSDEMAELAELGVRCRL